MRFACLSKEDKEELRKTAVNGKNSAEKRHWQGDKEQLSAEAPPC